MTTLDGLMKTHGFIHIPKIGGTSIEERLNGTMAIIRRWHRRRFPAYPQHLPPDVYEALSGQKYVRPSFCVVREPRERLQSCLNWVYSRTFKTPLANLSSVFATGRVGLQWTDERTHRMPQSWFVWGDDGRVLCDCVVAYEKLDLQGVHSNRVRTHTRGTHTFPRALYAMDALLHRTALRHPELCFRPEALWSDLAADRASPPPPSAFLLRRP